jgi:glutamine synthetase
MFLAFFVNTIKAVHDHADLLRAAIASAGNDHRLGANEAPPAIISAYIGGYLAKVLDEVESRVGNKFDEQDEVMLKLDIHKNIPELLLDNTDRNRTSPFAFTGNKFEFRAVGSSANCGYNMTVLNTIMAETLSSFKSEVDGLIEKGDKKEVAIMQVIKNYITASKKVLFEGDGYSDEWEKEAEKRGLPNVKTTPLALDALITNKAKNLFEKHKILSHSELEARYEIELEKYIKYVQIEGRVIGDLAGNHILPAAIRYQNVLINNIKGLKDLGLKSEAYNAQLNILNEISEHINKVQVLSEKMTEARKAANTLSSSRDKAIAYCEQVKPFFEEIRYSVDKLELLVDDSEWELPKYRELLFLR